MSGVATALVRGPEELHGIRRLGNQFGNHYPRNGRTGAHKSTNQLLVAAMHWSPVTGCALMLRLAGAR